MKDSSPPGQRITDNEASLRLWDHDKDSLLDLSPLKSMDRKELEAATGYHPLDALQHSIDITSDELWTIDWSGTLCAVYGVAEDSYGYGIPWFIGTEAMDQLDGIALARASRAVVDLWCQEYPCLHNFVMASYPSAHKWLRFMGFEILDESPVTLHNPSEPFYYFWRHSLYV